MEAKHNAEIIEDIEDWTFNGSSTREYSHVYHDYPARMIPQVARKLLRLYGTGSKTLFDPYCGTGSSLVEGLIYGLDVIGTDINPLARLIAEAKTDYSVDPLKLEEEISRFYEKIYETRGRKKVPNVKNIDYWFKPSIIPKLGRIRYYLDNIEDVGIKRFFQVAFSETVRESSNTRKGEFKLFRYGKEQLNKLNPDPYAIMLSKFERNKAGLIQFRSLMANLPTKPSAKILGLNSVNQIPSKEIPENSVDIVITSPPYGDSHTTVAYGQYSRLSSEWLSLISEENIDNKSMGGSPLKEIPDFPSDSLNAAIESIKEKNFKRALEVASFYKDLLSSINNVSKLIAAEGYVCYVVGNRTVSSVILPTSDVIRDFFSFYGLKYVTTHLRSIPNKRMPARNSPSNISGQTSNTMLNEHIVVLRKL
ncbi:MAG: DNA methyltransferase [Thermoplasmata archaeon]